MTKEKAIQPFVQWVGGKRKIANQLMQYIPNGLNNYYEPFLGGGALFFNIRHLFNQCFLSDVNLDLVTSYNTIKNNPDEVHRQVMELNSKHTEDNYYRLNEGNYTTDPVGITARFIYVNKHSFKGIFRINRKGQLKSTCNTRRWKGVDFDKTLKQCSRQLTGVTIYANDFSFITPAKDDFVYFDPPYHKVGERFYTRLPFDENEQIRLREFVTSLSDKGVKVMVSNSNTDFIRGLYSDLNITEVDINYSINNKNAKELIITNNPK